MRRQRRSSAGRGGQGGHRPTHRARTDHVHLCQPPAPPLLLLLLLLALLLVLVPVVVPLLVLVLLVLVLVPLACCYSLLDPSGLVPFTCDSPQLTTPLWLVAQAGAWDEHRSRIQCVPALNLFCLLLSQTPELSHCVCGCRCALRCCGCRLVPPFRGQVAQEPLEGCRRCRADRVVNACLLR